MQRQYIIQLSLGQYAGRIGTLGLQVTDIRHALTYTSAGDAAVMLQRARSWGYRRAVMTRLTAAMAEERCLTDKERAAVVKPLVKPVLVKSKPKANKTVKTEAERELARRIRAAERKAERQNMATKAAQQAALMRETIGVLMQEQDGWDAKNGLGKR
jgi:hypothetical protein